MDVYSDSKGSGTCQEGLATAAFVLMIVRMAILAVYALVWIVGVPVHLCSKRSN